MFNKYVLLDKDGLPKNQITVSVVVIIIMLIIALLSTINVKKTHKSEFNSGNININKVERE